VNSLASGGRVVGCPSVVVRKILHFRRDGAKCCTMMAWRTRARPSAYLPRLSRGCRGPFQVVRCEVALHGGTRGVPSSGCALNLSVERPEPDGVNRSMMFLFFEELDVRGGGGREFTPETEAFVARVRHGHGRIPCTPAAAAGASTVR
jgi:hypothetical protein